eukprot:CAMPEP_0194668052 /NCGR_PEP_ID=MMETSP0295-20121207/3688_1 /TAXON_ID=39354 /ORGANISM="Heterosigma akashiwo, Strain CCMP2393" /LENGTH=121 /DNA_ID=CAMNT_0039550633 /DNA_START=755 /DNA_END=1120 /DNA_ORIENTATION=-
MRGPRDVTIHLIEAVQAVLDKAAAAATTAVTEVVAAAGMAAVTVVAIEGAFSRHPIPTSSALCLDVMYFSHDGRSASLLNKHTIEEHPNLELTALPQGPQFLPLALYPGPRLLLSTIPRSL